MGPHTDKHLPPNLFTGQFLRKDDLKGWFLYSYLVHGDISAGGQEPVFRTLIAEPGILTTGH
jgi:hypothetical protein